MVAGTRALNGAAKVKPTQSLPRSPRPAACSTLRTACSARARIHRALPAAPRRHLSARGAAAPEEELCSQLALEQPDLLAQRLGNREPLGGAAEMAFFGQGDKVAKMMKLRRDGSGPGAFSGASLLPVFGSLISRFNSLIGRLGKLARLQR